MGVIGLVGLAVGAVAPSAGAQFGPDLSPSSLVFDVQNPGSTSPAQTVVLTAAGSTVTTLSITGDFVIAGGTCHPGSIVSESSPCDVEVAFSPIGPGPASGVLTVVVDLDVAVEATLSGEGSTTTTDESSTTTVPTTTTTGPPSSTTPATSVPVPTTPTTSGLPVTPSVPAGPPPTTVPVPVSPGAGGPTLDATAPGGGRSGPPGVGLTIVGSGYRPPGGRALGELVLVASPPAAQPAPDCRTAFFFLDGRRVGSAAPGDDGVVREGGLSVPGGTRPALYSVSSSCDSSGTPVLASSRFLVTKATVHRSAFATALPGPGLVDLAPHRLAVSALAVVGLLVLIAFPAELFNTTLEEHYDEVRGWFHLRARRRAAGGRKNAVLLVGFLLLAGPLWFAMQSASRIDASTALGALGLSLATAVVVIGSDLPTLLHVRRHAALQAGLVALPGTLLLTVGCVALSRAVHFEPGYFYGLVGGVAVGSQIRSDTAGRLAGACAGLMLALSVGSWLALGPVSAAARQPAAGLGVILAEAVLGGIFWAALDSLVIALLPLRLLLGAKVAGWDRRAWVVLYGLTLFAFVHILLRPGSGYVSDTTVSQPLVAFGLFAGFAAISFGFWGYFRFRPARPAAGEGPLDEAGA